MYELFRTGTLLLAAGGENGGGHGAYHFEPTLVSTSFYFLVALVIVFVVLSLAKKGFKDQVFKNPFTCMLEQLYLFLENLAVGIIGPHGRKYLPFAMTFWLMIFFCNLVALVAPTAPTADLSFNLGMALISIGYVQWEGMKTNGVFGHFKHFAGPKLPFALIPISLMIFVIEIISEAMKNVSLSLRIFGNIDGGHRAAAAMNEIGSKMFPFAGGNATGIPFGYFLLPIKFLTCLVQAMLFSLLFMVYVSLVTSHEHEEEEGHPRHNEHDAEAVLAGSH